MLGTHSFLDLAHHIKIMLPEKTDYSRHDLEGGKEYCEARAGFMRFNQRYSRERNCQTEGDYLLRKGILGSLNTTSQKSFKCAKSLRT